MTQLQYPLVDVSRLVPARVGRTPTGSVADGVTFRQGIGAAEGSGSVAWHLTVAPGAAGLRYTRQDSDELVYHVAGTGLAGQGDRRIDCRPGLCRLIPKGTPQFFVADPDGSEAVVVGFAVGVDSFDADLTIAGTIDHAAAAAHGSTDGNGASGLAVHLDDVAPERMASGDGWLISDFRLPIGGHNGSASTLFRARFLPDAIHKKHRHENCDEIYYIISGHGLAGAGADRVDVHGGQFHYIPRGVEHWLYNLSDTDPIEVVGIYVEAESVAATGYVYMGEVERTDLGR